MTISDWWFKSKNRLKQENKALGEENKRLLELLADPKLISVQVDQNAVEIQMQPREEVMRNLFVMMAHALGDSPNFVECVFGPDPETGKSYELTLRHYHGKTPGQVYGERIKMLREAIVEHPTREVGETASDYDERIRLWWNNKIVPALKATNGASI